MGQLHKMLCGIPLPFPAHRKQEANIYHKEIHQVEISKQTEINVLDNLSLLP